MLLYEEPIIPFARHPNPRAWATRLPFDHPKLTSIAPATDRGGSVRPSERAAFEHLPAATTIEQIEALLPWNVKAVLDEQKKKSLEPRNRPLPDAANVYSVARNTSTGLIELRAMIKRWRCPPSGAHLIRWDC